MSDLVLCALVPTYDNPLTIGLVVNGIRNHVADVIVVDDGSERSGQRAVAGLAALAGVRVHRRATNGGKGRAVMEGLVLADARGFTHALQIDADGQHDLDDIPRFLDAARAAPDALVIGAPTFDRSAPWPRVVGRRITRFWTHVETSGKRVIHDALCGYRVYPIGDALRAGARGTGMDFDPEIAVRLAWRRVPVVNIQTRVRYLPPEHGGVSHFRMCRDNMLITRMHIRLVCGAARRCFARS